MVGRLCFESTGSGVFSDDLDIFVSFRFPNKCTVLYTEIYAINLAARKIGKFYLPSLAIVIYR